MKSTESYLDLFFTKFFDQSDYYIHIVFLNIFFIISRPSGIFYIDFLLFALLLVPKYFCTCVFVLYIYLTYKISFIYNISLIPFAEFLYIHPKRAIDQYLSLAKRTFVIMEF